MMKYDLIASGYCSLDRIVRIDSPARLGRTSLITNSDNSQIYYGGCSINVCYLLSKIGFATLPLLRVGSDYEATGFKKYLEGSGMHLDALKIVPADLTSNCYLIQDPNCEHITLFYPGAMDEKHFEPVDSRFFSSSRYALMTVASLADNRYFLEECKKHGLPLILGMKMDASAFPKDFLIDVLSYAKIIFINESESRCVCEAMGINDVGELFGRTRVEVVVKTRGSKGSTCYHLENGKPVSSDIGIVKAARVVDTVGSGDAYIAGFLYAYFSGKEVADCARYGATMASFILEGMGATSSAPSREELEARFLKSFGGQG